MLMMPLEVTLLLFPNQVKSIEDGTFKMVRAAAARADAAGSTSTPERKDHSLLHYLLGKLYTSIGMLDEAVASWQRATSIAKTIPGV